MNLWILLVDILLLYGTFLLSYLMRYGINIPQKSFAPFSASHFFLVGIIVIAMAYTKVFRRRFRSYWLVFQRLVLGLSLGTAFSFIFMYVMRDKWARFPTSVLLLNLILAVLILFLVNSLILRSKGKIKKRIVILGDEDFYDPFQKNDTLVRKKIISSIEELMNIPDVDEVMICKRLSNEPNLNLLIFLLLKLNVVVTFSPDAYADLITDSISKDEVSLFSTFMGRRSESHEFWIRMVDIVVSLTSILLLGPLLFLIALFIKFNSHGPVIYTQKRVGKDRKLFTIYKFRTMMDNAEDLHGHKPALRDDARITRVGRFLRRTRLDELPQLLNVLQGQMSLVGPRPENVSRVNTHKVFRGLRLAVKPGITGLAQIQRSYDLQPKHKIKYDFLYIQRRSLLLNLYILFKTIPVVFGCKGQ